MMRTLAKLFAVLLTAAGVIVGAYIWITILIAGLTDAVNGAKMNPTDGGKIAWGIIQATPLSEIAGAAIFLVCFGVAAIFWHDSREELPYDLADKMHRPSQRTSKHYQFDWDKLSGKL
jgi:hypothetical protein